MQYFDKVLQSHVWKLVYLYQISKRRNNTYLKSDDWHTLYGSYLSDQRNSLSHFFFSLSNRRNFSHTQT